MINAVSQKNKYLFHYTKLNVLGIRVGDRVRVSVWEDSCDNECEVEGEVVEVRKRWFRIRIEKKYGYYYTCIHFVSTKCNGEKLSYCVV